MATGGTPIVGGSGTPPSARRKLQPHKAVSADLHIPMCGNQTCNTKVSNLAECLETKGINCVTAYKPYGKFEKWFTEGFNSTSFTILHQCLILWKKIKNFKHLLLQEDKIMAVQLTDESTNEIQSKHGDETFLEFFEEHMNTPLTSPQNIETFIDTVMTLFETHEQTDDSYSKCQASKEDRQNQTKEKGTNSEEISVLPDHQLICQEEFELQPDPLACEAQTQTFVRASCLDRSNHEVFDVSRSIPCNRMKAIINDLRSKFAKDPKVICSNLKHIIFDVLPHMYKERMIVGLATVATCDELSIQNISQTMIENIMFQNQGASEGMDLKSLLDMEYALSRGLKDLHQQYLQEDTSRLQMKIERLASLYLMLSCEIALDNQDKAKSEKHFKDASRQFHAVSKGTSSINEGRYIGNIFEFIKEMKDKSSETLKRTNSIITLANINQQAKDLISSNSFAVQILVIFSLLKKVFRGLDIQALDLLEEYSKPNRSTFGKSKEAPIACIVLLLRGLSHFICYRLKDFVDQDIKCISQRAIGVIKTASKRDLPDEVGRLMQCMLYEPNPNIRKEIINFYNERNSYAKHLTVFLMHEVERLLSPLLIFSHGSKTHLNGQWSMTSGYFDNCEAAILIHKPTPRTHFEDNFTKFTLPTQEDFQINELKRLKELQHPNILKLFAYQENHIPQFYIVEDYTLNNLQIALKNRSENHAFFSRSLLYKFLMDACTALEYCHSKEFVHRNIIASSLFTIQGQRAKLCGFQVCLKLVNEGKFIDQNNVAVPRLWTSPESLEKGEYSKASDVWMFGHLMYEVLTHGLMPYSHVHQSDIGIIQQIVDGNISLLVETCFEQKASEVINSCVQHESKNRPKISDVCSMIKNLYDCAVKNKQQDNRIEYPDLSKGKVKSSVEYKRGTMSFRRQQIKSLKHPSTTEELYSMLSPTRRVYRNGQKLVIKEQLMRLWPLDMSIQIQTGVLDSILAPIKVYQIEEHNHSQYLEFSFPPGCIGNLLDVTKNQKLKKDSPRLYIYCIYQVAVIMKNMHDNAWLFGDLCATNVFIQTVEGDVKVHMGSHAQLVYLKRPESQETLPKPEELDVLNRAAPEVQRRGIYSLKSDVFCFGNFMWQVLNAFDHKTMPTRNNQRDVIGDSQPTQENRNSLCEVDQDFISEAEEVISSNWKSEHPKPNCCTIDLYDLIGKCVCLTALDRPSASQIVEIIEKHCLDTFTSTGYVNIVDNSLQAIDQFSSGSSLLQLELDEINDSECSCFDSEWSSMTTLSSLNSYTVHDNQTRHFSDIISRSSLFAESPIATSENMNRFRFPSMETEVKLPKGASNLPKLFEPKGASNLPMLLESNSSVCSSVSSSSSNIAYDDIDDACRYSNSMCNKGKKKRSVKIVKKFKSFAKEFLFSNFSSQQSVEEKQAEQTDAFATYQYGTFYEDNYYLMATTAAETLPMQDDPQSPGSLNDVPDPDDDIYEPLN